MAKKTINLKLKEKNSYEFSFNYANSTSDSFYLITFDISKEDKEKVQKLLCKEEFEMFNQIKKAQQAGSSMLVMLGLRSLIESLVKKICIENKIDTWVTITRNGKDEATELGLTSKFHKIKTFISDRYAKETILNIITIANLTTHELLNQLKNNESEKYLKDFIIILKSEKIFNKLN